MADVPYTPGSGVTISADLVGTTLFQRNKIVLGTSGTNLGDVDVTNPFPVTGTVTASVSTVVSGTITVSAMPAVSGTVTVNVSGVVPVTTQASVSVAGVPVWLNPTQAVAVNTIAAGFSVNALVTGAVSVSAMPAVSVSVSAILGTVVAVSGVTAVSAVSTIVTLLGTVAVNVVAGGAGGGSVTTTAPGITATGQVMWIVGGQSTTVSPVFASVATVETIVTLLGTVAVNVVAGGAGGGSVTTAVPSISATGQVMWVVGGQSTTAFPVVITGTVTAGAGTTVVSIQNVVAVTTAASVSVSGLPVWLNPTQAVVVNTIAVGFSVNASVSVSAILGTIIAVSGITAVSAVSTIVTILGTQIVSVVPGVSVLASISGVVPVTTAISVSVSGLPVWFNPTAAIGTVVTILTTVNVAIVAGAAGGGSVTTTAPGITATGQVVWIVGGQSTTVSPVFASVPTVQTILTIVTQLGTQVVSIVPGVSISLGSMATGVFTTTATSGVTGPIVWLGVGQTIATVGTVTTILGTQIVSVVPGLSVLASITVSAIVGTVIAVSGVTAVSTIVTILGTQIVSVAGGSNYVTNPASAASGLGVYIVGLSTTALSGVTGPVVWLGASQSVSIASQLLQPVLIMISSTLVGSNTTLLMTVYTGATFVTTGASFWVVPAGKVFRVMAMNIANVSSAVLGRGYLQVIVGTAAASLSVTSTVGVAAALPYAIQASTGLWAAVGMVADIQAATTVGVAITGGTTQSILGAAIQGYLF